MTKALLIGLAALPLAVGCSSDGSSNSDAVDQVQDDDSSSDSATTAEPGTTVSQPIQDDQADDTTVAEPEPVGDSVAEADPSRRWEAASSLTGELEQIVSWSDGFAAIMDTDGDETPGGGGELWYSPDGVEWEAAIVRPFGHSDDIYALAGQGDQLFALSGDVFDNAAPQTLWRRGAGAPWEEVMTHTALEHIAVTSDRLVAYEQQRFEVVGVFDTTTMAPVEFAGWPAANIETDGEVAIEPFAYEGRVIGLDEGFLATVSWLHVVEESPDEPQIDRRMLHSTDGSTWIEHPSPPPGGVELYGDIHGDAVAPVFEGRNLVASQSSPEFEERGAAWVTDSGMEFEFAPLPPSSEAGRSDAAFWVGRTDGTEAGFFMVAGGVIQQSLDGLEWNIIESPPTWSAPAGFDGRGLAHGTILATDDALIAVGVHGQFEGWVGLVNPNTDIWVTER